VPKNPLKLGFGTSESTFNTWVSKQINVIPGCGVDKIPGGMFKSNLPDHIGFLWGRYAALEQKFIPGFKSTARPTTVLCGTGGSKTNWAPGQRKWLKKRHRQYAEWADKSGPNCRFYIGGLVGVLGTKTEPDIVFGVTENWIRLAEKGITVELCRKMRVQALRSEGQFFSLRVDSDGSQRIRKQSSIHGLLANLGCHWPYRE